MMALKMSAQKFYYQFVIHLAFNNFYNQVHEFFLSLTGHGTAVFYIEEAPELPDLMFFRSLNVK